ncbi:MAG: MBL fold metallo-hydrolase [Burkholderiales bacterium]|nr:MBL fold metallo-hydrolase [Burkholderiales bacterium]
MRASAPVPSPCISVCRIDDTTGWCEGCLRTLDEIAAWGSLDDDSRRRTWASIGERRTTLAGGKLPPTLRFIERDWLSSNQIVGFDAGIATVVDTGYAKHAPLTVLLIERVLREAGGARLGRIVNTHLHSDHCGGNRALTDAFGCTTTIPQASAAEVAAWDEAVLTFVGTGQRCPRFSFDAVLAPGDTLRLGELDWRVLAAPGHDPKSLIFHCPDARLLISADALWASGFGVLFPELQGESGFAEQQAVLDLIATLPVDRALPGHGPMIDDVPAALARAQARLQAMRSDPARHARHALKVLVKFLMLDVERIEAERLAANLRGAHLLRDSAALLGLQYDAALRWAIDELVDQGQLQRDGRWLMNV